VLDAGRLVFREGALVTALRCGHWVVLDELNLAPTEVLEALNRWVKLLCWAEVQCWASLTVMRA
jgi:midasin (ATPase involved in ribosome maturation)